MRSTSEWRAFTAGCILFTVLISFSILTPAEEPRDFKTNYVFVIDVSESVVGYGGTPIIFLEVKRVLRQYVDQIKTGSNLFIFPFDSGIQDSVLWENVSRNRG